MRRAPDRPPAAEIAATLEAVDATLAGDPVDPDRAEVAELVLLLAGDRSKPADEFGRELDRRVEGRFGAASKAAAKATRRRNRRRWGWVLAPAGALAAVAAIVGLVASTPGGSTMSSSAGGSSMSAMLRPRPRSAVPRALHPGVHAGPPSNRSGIPASSGLQPTPNGRRLIQSSHLTLGAAPTRIETVAQEALKVVGAHNGFVDSATVDATGGNSGYARLQLTVPSATLPQTMTLLSGLPYSTVLSRMDKIEDVTAQLQSAKRNHQSARVHTLEQGIAYSKVSVDVEADATSSAPTHRAHGGGFTIGRAAHDALGVLTVIGGIALIALAVLLPLAAVCVLGWQIWAAIRRRQREQALDLA